MKIKVVRTKVNIAVRCKECKGGYRLELVDGYILPDINGISVHKTKLGTYSVDHWKSGYQVVPSFCPERLCQAVEMVEELGKLAERRGFEWNEIPLNYLSDHRDVAQEILALRDMVISKHVKEPQITLPPEDADWVIFRKYPAGEVVALFPGTGKSQGNYHMYCQNYMHVGQHSAARYSKVMKDTKPASLDDPEVQALKKELESEPYNYKIIVLQRAPSWRYIEAEQKRNGTWRGV